MTENGSSFCSTEMSETTISKSVWKLRRYGRLLPSNKKECTNTSWKVSVRLNLLHCNRQKASQLALWLARLVNAGTTHFY